MDAPRPTSYVFRCYGIRVHPVSIALLVLYTAFRDSCHAHPCTAQSEQQTLRATKKKAPGQGKKKKKKKDPNMQVPPPTQTLIDPFQMRPKWLEQGLGSQGSKEGRKEKKKKTRTPWTWPPLNNQNRACSQPPPRKSCAAAVSYAEPKRPLCVSLFPLQFLDILDKRLLVCLLPPQSVSARRHGFEGTIKGN